MATELLNERPERRKALNPLHQILFGPNDISVMRKGSCERLENIGTVVIPISFDAKIPRLNNTLDDATFELTTWRAGEDGNSLRGDP